ncbi:unnamed protein product [Amoebophrya sp. A120]|nr:unnamed protein product [Amoebophrya sp. A120]|eukprot:GSA120T00002741001.1
MPVNNSQEEQLRRLHAEIEQTTRKLELAKRRSLKLKEDLSKAKREYEASYLSRRPPDQKALYAAKQLQENKQAKALLRLDALNHENNSLRLTIEGVRRDRLQCNAVMKKVKDALREKERNIQAIDQAARDARGMLQEIVQSQSKAKTDREKQQRDWKLKLRKVQEDLRLERARDLGSLARGGSGAGGGEENQNRGGGTNNPAPPPSRSANPRPPVLPSSRGAAGDQHGTSNHHSLHPQQARELNENRLPALESNNEQSSGSSSRPNAATSSKPKTKQLTISTAPPEEMRVAASGSTSSPSSPRKHPLGGYVNCTPKNLPKTPASVANKDGAGASTSPTSAGGGQLHTAQKNRGELLSRATKPTTPRPPSSDKVKTNVEHAKNAMRRQMAGGAKTPSKTKEGEEGNKGSDINHASGGQSPSEKAKNGKATPKPKRASSAGGRGGRRLVTPATNKEPEPNLEANQFSEHRFMRFIFKAAFCNAIQRRHIKQHQKSIQIYEQAFSTIRSSTGISDIEEIVKIFTKLEERNYSLLVYVNLLSRDIESLSRKRAELLQTRRTEIEKRREDGKLRRQMVQQVQQKIDRFRRMTEENNAQMKAAHIPTEVETLIKNVAAILRDEHRNLLLHNRSLAGNPLSPGVGDHLHSLSLGAGGPLSSGFASSGPSSAGMNNVTGALGGFGTQLIGVPAAYQTNDQGSTAGVMLNQSYLEQVALDEEDVSLVDHLTWIERCLTQWREFLPATVSESISYRNMMPKPFPYTVAHEVKAALSPKKQLPTLLKAADLPHSGAAVLAPPGGVVTSAAGDRDKARGKEDDDSDEDDDHALTREELQSKVNSLLAKRKKKFANVRLTTQRRGSQGEDVLAKITAGAGELKPDSDDSSSLSDSESSSSGFSSSNDSANPTDEQINEIFLKRYKMSKAELVAMAEKMGIALSNLCYLKQEFDMYDEDSSGFIDLDELRELLQKLGEDLSEEELHQAFKELDQDCSGEIEFFEFVEWFTTEE